MDTQTFIEVTKEIQEVILGIIDESDLNYNNYELLQKIINDHGIHENKLELKGILHLIVKIANNHSRLPTFFTKIEKILSIYKTEILELFENENELFDIFKSNKRLLLFIINEKILEINESIAITMISNKYRKFGYANYFFFEISEIFQLPQFAKIIQEINEENIQVFNTNEYQESFKKMRKEGENHHYIANLIRNDEVEEFVSYVTRSNLDLTSKIEPSIFETNTFLLKNKPNLIEYSTFFGSIQIFKYLFYTKNDLLSPSLWIYAIHGRNPEMIHFLEENHVRMPMQSYHKCLNECIKCHHNELANYILNNYTDINTERDDSFFAAALKYYNYDYFPTNLDNSFVFFHLSKNDYFNIVKDTSLFPEPEINENFKLILNLYFFNEIQNQIFINYISNFNILIRF